MNARHMGRVKSVDKIALVTGASRGIGAAIARALAREGYDLCLNYLTNKALAEELAEELRSPGCRVITHRADVACIDQVREMFCRVERELGHVSLLVNNAGVSLRAQIQDILPCQWQRIMAVNAGGCYNCISCTLPPMLEAHEGCIINISSIWGSRAASCESAYAASKHAVEGLSRSLAAELAPSHIRVNCIAPGVIGTDMLHSLGEEKVEEIYSQMPLERFGSVEDAAQAAVYLAKAEYVTGTVLTVDGGFTL